MMFAPGYYVTAELRVKNPEQVMQARKALALLADKTLHEAGCSIFTVHQDAAEPTRFLLWERFDDEAAFKQHFLEAHTQDYLALDLTEVVQYWVSDVVAPAGA
ncbi:putative quinol monooxygenase [Vandammella animalimorsus]|nr:antibiotic biosynthesis monooxygenase [Vandammella animalimorsus]